LGFVFGPLLGIFVPLYYLIACAWHLVSGMSEILNSCDTSLVKSCPVHFTGNPVPAKKFCSSHVRTSGKSIPNFDTKIFSGFVNIPFIHLKKFPAPANIILLPQKFLCSPAKI
jgi:hypothetical protein